MKYISLIAFLFLAACNAGGPDENDTVEYNESASGTDSVTAEDDWRTDQGVAESETSAETAPIVVAGSPSIDATDELKSYSRDIELNGEDGPITLTHSEEFVPSEDSVFAASADGENVDDECDSILRNGIWEYNKSQGSTSQANSFLSWFCSNEFSSAGSANEASAQAGFPLFGFPVNVGGYNKNSQWSSYSKEMCRQSSGSYTYASSFLEASRRASSAITEAWTACMINSYGFRATVQYNNNPNILGVSMRFRSDQNPPGAGAELKKGQEGFAVRPYGAISCSPNPANTLSYPTGLAVGAQRDLVCERNPWLSIHDDIFLALNGNYVLRPSGLLTISGHPRLPDPNLPDDQSYKITACNDTSVEKIWVTVGYRPDFVLDRWRYRGWYALKKGECAFLLRTPNKYYYTRAIGGGKVWKKGLDNKSLRLCSSQKAHDFTLEPGNRQCPAYAIVEEYGQSDAGPKPRSVLHRFVD